MRKSSKLIVVAGALAALAVPSVASASVTIDPDGTGFVGKGDVQTVLGFNNAQMQANAANLSFTYAQPFTQSAEQTATQTGTQSGTQSVTQDLSCTIEGKNKTFHRDGSRSATRDGSREGSREGVRTGTVSGKISSAVDYDARRANQVNGFILKGKVSGSESTTTNQIAWDGAFAYGAYDFGNWSYSDDDAIEWGDWQAEPGESPADCLRTDTPQGTPQVTDLVNTITEGDTVPGATYDGDVTEHDATFGPQALEAAKLFVNGQAL